MIREGNAGKAGEHVLRRDPLFDECAEGRRHAAMEEIGAESVERDENRRRRKQGRAVGQQWLSPGCAVVGGSLVCAEDEDKEENEDGREGQGVFQP